jgi:hypothetical protein
MEWLATPALLRTPEYQKDLAVELGVSRETLDNWKNTPLFQDEVNKTVRLPLRDKLPEIYASLIKEAEAGSYLHIKLLLEMAGEYTRVQHNINQNNGETTVRFVWGDAEPVALLEDEDYEVEDADAD